MVGTARPRFCPPLAGHTSAFAHPTKRPLTRIPSLRCASLGIRPLPQGERWSKRLARARTDHPEIVSTLPFQSSAFGDVVHRTIERLVIREAELVAQNVCTRNQVRICHGA